MTEELDVSDKSDSEDECAFSSDFHFVDTAAEYFHDTWSDLTKLVKKKKTVKIDEKISRAIEKRKSKNVEDNMASQINGEEEEEEKLVKDTLRTKKKKGKDPRAKQKAITVEGVENEEDEPEDVTQGIFW
ncbi:hypothetical protein MRX96_057738 [Rhipicephalus microplus]